MTFLGLINDLTMLIEYVAVKVLRGTRTSPVQSRGVIYMYCRCLRSGSLESER